jgi:deoxyribodipyrimidine photo-lyase
MMKQCILWFRNDLRLSDHPALVEAIQHGYRILPIYLVEKHDGWEPGEASRWWLHHALTDLDTQLKELGTRLHCYDARNEGTEATMAKILDESGAEVVMWSRRYEPESIQRDTALKQQLEARGCAVQSFASNLLHEPFTVKNLSGGPYKVFTPYWKKCQTMELRPIARVELKLATWGSLKSGVSVDALGILPSKDWVEGLGAQWDPSRAGLLGLLKELKSSKAAHYSESRDLVAEDGTSRLSPYLAHGQVSPIEIVTLLKGVDSAYVRQLYWRDFSYHLLYHFPETDSRPLRPEWEMFPWGDDPKVIKLWQRGLTGYPVVDAAMRQLWQTGWMHNRARMIVASVLVKHFQLDWMIGARWFWDTLVDADLANNSMGWQWSAGCGADAAPYFRVFNPVTQGQKFDPQGDYVKRYVPELAELPKKYIHCPWEAPSDVLDAAGVQLGRNYPKPTLLPAEGRQRALDAYADYKKQLQR